MFRPAHLRDVRIELLQVRPLGVALVEPFVIATGRVDVTRNVEIEARLTWEGRTATGLGEAACLPPVTREDQPDVLRELEGRTIEAEDELANLSAVARAGVETAACDAMARIAGVPLRALLSEQRCDRLETDITLAIAAPEKMASLAREWVGRGFRALKVKVGKNLDEDLRALEAIVRAAPQARLRVDANAGHSSDEAIELARASERLGVNVECWEQPCAPEDHDGMARVAAAVAAPVIADESVKSMDDLRVLIARPYADGVNLKLAKSGGPLACFAIGQAARAAGLRIMVGGMVETRLGMTAAAHLACALGGADFVDLDTAWLLADDPYEGGYLANGPFYRLPEAPGLDVRRR